MSTTLHMSNFCDFTTIDNIVYECKNCGKRITVHDEYSTAPILLCQNSLKRDKDQVSFVKKIKNFGAAVVNHMVSGFPTCTEEQIIKRHNICRSCEFMKKNTCTKCGCPLIRNKVYVSKLAWADQECPIGKWTKVTSS